jgi:hypothetical protein
MMEATGLIEETFLAIDDGRIWDTMHRDKLMSNAVNELRTRWDPFTGKIGKSFFNLPDLTMRYLGIDVREEKTDPDSWRLRYAELDGVPLKQWPSAAVEYAMLDAVYAFLICLHQEDMYPDQLDGWPTRDPERPARFQGEIREIQADIALNLMAAYGLRTDPELVDKTLARWKKLADKGNAVGLRAGFLQQKKDGSVSRVMVKLQQAVANAYGFEGVLGTPMITQRKAGPHARIRTINGDNAPYDFTPDDIRETRPEIVTDPSRMYPHGQVKDATEVLRDAPYKSKPLQKYSKSKQAINFLSKWDNPDRPVLRIGTQGPITYSVDSLKVTGRTGVRKPAMQQPPKVLGFRECFVPRPGWLYAGADYSQVEMRCWAQVLEWWELGTTLGDALRAGMDPHVMMGVSLLNASDKYLEDWDYESFLHA